MRRPWASRLRKGQKKNGGVAGKRRRGMKEFNSLMRGGREGRKDVSPQVVQERGREDGVEDGVEDG